MTKPIFIPLESLEAEEDNEPPSLIIGHNLLNYLFFHLASPSYSLTNKPNLIRKNPFFSRANLSGIKRQGFFFCISLSGSVGKVLTFSWNPYSGYSAAHPVL